jgi:hypothetical protein
MAMNKTTKTAKTTKAPGKSHNPVLFFAVLQNGRDINVERMGKRA